MAKKKKPTSEPQLALEAQPAPAVTDALARIVEGKEIGRKYYVGAAVGYPLLQEGLITVDDTDRNPQDDEEVAAYPTDAGIARIRGVQPKAFPVSDGYAIDDYMPPRSVRSRSPNGSIYPFDSLQVGQSFHVPATAAMPKPARTLASATSLATRKYAVASGYESNPDGSPKLDRNGDRVPKWEKTRVFAVQIADPDDPRGPGARVKRMA
jgi:hypothetical protein